MSSGCTKRSAGISVPSHEEVKVEPGNIAVTFTLYFDSSALNTSLRLNKADLVTE
ncbi:hypothetical protein D3C86_1966870 [compost metagenome]